MVIRKRYLVFPWFTALLISEIAQTLLLFVLYWFTNHTVYFYAYWVLDIADGVLSLCVIWELASKISKALQFAKVNASRDLQNALCLLMPFTAAAIWYLVPETRNAVQAIAVKVSLVSSILIGGLSCVLFLSFFFYGLRLRMHAATITLGMVAMFIPKFLMHLAVFGTGIHWWSGLERDLKPINIVCFLVWCVSLWLEEPATPVNDPLVIFLQAQGNPP